MKIEQFYPTVHVLIKKKKGVSKSNKKNIYSSWSKLSVHLVTYIISYNRKASL